MTEDLPVAKVSFVLPAYNEAENIQEAILGLKKTVRDAGLRRSEIIVVDDGSVDGTMREALKVADGAFVKVFGYRSNRGKGFAVKYGVERASGDFIVFLDSDLEVRLSSLATYLNTLKRYDLVIASKRHPQSRLEAPVIRKFLSYGFHVLVELLTGVRVTDTQSGFKAGRAAALKRVFKLMSVKNYAFDVEMLTVARLLKCRIKELPVEMKMGGLFSLRGVVRMLVDILGIAYRLRVKRWYQANLNKEYPVYKPIIRW